MKLLKSMLILSSLFALVGCHGDMSPAASTFRPQQVKVSPDLKDEISFSPVMTSYKGGSLHVEIPLQSTTDFDINVAYRLTYYDDGRNIVGSPTVWQTRLLHSNVFETITGDAPNPQARDFQLELKSAN
jgi:uncharacterized protein YcfL